MSRNHEPKTAERLLREREARGLIWSITGRLGLVGLVVFASLTTALTLHEGILLGLMFVGLIQCIFGMTYARRKERLGLVGTSGVLFDLLFLLVIPLAWYENYAGQHLSPVFLLKLPLAGAIALIMSINTLSLKPRYPAIIAVGSLIIQASLLWYGLRDPRTTTTEDLFEQSTTAAVNVHSYVVTMVGTVLFGILLTFLCRAARRMVTDVVALQVENQRVVEEQAHLAMELKMTELANLVAGIAHELNTPLGATMSSVDTLEQGAQKISAAIDSAQDIQSLRSDRTTGRVLHLLSDSSRVIKDAGERMSGVVESLKSFSRLDQAEIQQTDLRSDIDSTLAVIPQKTKGETRIQQNYGEIPRVEARPKELNQVFLALLTNAFDSMDGKGTLSVHLSERENAVAIEITDSGHGLPPENVERMFEIGFEAAGGRMGMGLSLATARNIIHRHGGTIEVQSSPDNGTTFRILLPVRAGNVLA